MAAQAAADRYKALAESLRAALGEAKDSVSAAEAEKYAALGSRLRQLRPRHGWRRAGWAEADAAGAALSRKESEELSRELASLRGERDALVGESSRQTAQLDVAYFYFLLASFFALLFASCARTRSGHLLRVWGAFGWSRHWRCGLQVLQFDLCFGLPLRSFLLHLQAIFELHAVQILLSFPHLHAAEGVQRMQCALCL